MKSNAKHLRNPLVVAIVAFTISLSAGGIAINADTRTAEEAKARANATQQIEQNNTVFIRNAFCGLLIPLTYVTPTSPGGITYLKSVKNTIHVLGCVVPPQQ